MVATSFKDATSQITSVENLTDVETCKGFTADGTTSSCSSRTDNGYPNCTKVEEGVVRNTVFLEVLL